MTVSGTVFLIDDDPGVRDALGWLLRSRRLISQPYESADAFYDEKVQAWIGTGPNEPCCALLDLRMPGMSGLALFERLLEQPWFATMPVIFLSGHADVPTAVDAVLRGAFDFCEKPFSNNTLVNRVCEALAQSASVLEQRKKQQRLKARLDTLTEREREVMLFVTTGMPNKLVADRLNISVRTVEVHRARVQEKMGGKNLADLIHIVHTLEQI